VSINAWQWEIFEGIVNSAPCSVTDPGPLLAPIEDLSIRRNEERELILTTTGFGDPDGRATSYPAGTIRRTYETVEFRTTGGFTAVAHGVIPRHWSRSHSVKPGSDRTKEEASVNSLVLTLQHRGAAQHTIEWIENFNAGHFIWPDGIADKSTHIETRTVGRGDDTITLKSTREGQSGRNESITLKIDGQRLYLGAAGEGLPKTLTRPGFILYNGRPDEIVREKIRNCLSFALGNYLIYLGCVVLDDRDNPVFIKAVNGNWLNDRVFKLPVLPPAPLGKRYEDEVDIDSLSRFVNALYPAYDDLSFDRLSWAYWHAMCAPIHIGAAHFGAAIEALQGAYVTAHPNQFQTRLIADKKQWQQLQSKLAETVKRAGLIADIEGVLTNRLASLNSVPTSKVSEQLFAHLGISLGNAEKDAWRQRHIAAHGKTTGEDPVKTIRDTKLLRLIFHRLLLKMTNASDVYRDYYSLNFPVRNLSEPVS
jgi:hypothetical protein